MTGSDSSYSCLEMHWIGRWTEKPRSKDNCLLCSLRQTARKLKTRVLLIHLWSCFFFSTENHCFSFFMLDELDLQLVHTILPEIYQSGRNNALWSVQCSFSTDILELQASPLCHFRPVRPPFSASFRALPCAGPPCLAHQDSLGPHETSIHPGLNPWRTWAFCLNFHFALLVVDPAVDVTSLPRPCSQSVSRVQNPVFKSIWNAPGRRFEMNCSIRPHLHIKYWQSTMKWRENPASLGLQFRFLQIQKTAAQSLFARILQYLVGVEEVVIFVVRSE